MAVSKKRQLKKSKRAVGAIKSERKLHRVASRVHHRNIKIKDKNILKADIAAIRSNKAKKTYKTTAQRVVGAAKSVASGNPQKRHEKKKKRAVIKGIKKGY